MTIRHRCKGANVQAGEILRFLGASLGFRAFFLVLVIMAFMVLIMLRLSLSEGLSKLTLAAFHVNLDTVIFRSARGGTVHKVSATSLISRN